MNYAKNVKLYCRINSEEILNNPGLVLSDPIYSALKDNELFSFDYIFNGNDVQKQLTSQIYENLMNCNDNGNLNTAFITYGQSKSGKSYSIKGNLESGNEIGILPTVVQYFLNQNKIKSFNYEIMASCFEIYNEKIIDLMTGGTSNLNFFDAKDGSVYVKNLTEINIKTKVDLFKLMKKAKLRMHKLTVNGKYTCNRSHVVYNIQIKEKLMNRVKIRKFSFIDLASYQNSFDKSFSKSWTNETKSINVSLTMLKSLIKSITNKEARPPYRNSKLSRLFSGVFKSNCSAHFLICMIMKSELNSEIRDCLEFSQCLHELKNFNQNFPQLSNWKTKISSINSIPSSEHSWSSLRNNYWKNQSNLDLSINSLQSLPSDNMNSIIESEIVDNKSLSLHRNDQRNYNPEQNKDKIDNETMEDENQKLNISQTITRDCPVENHQDNNINSEEPDINIEDKNIIEIENKNEGTVHDEVAKDLDNSKDFIDSEKESLDMNDIGPQEVYSNLSETEVLQSNVNNITQQQPPEKPSFATNLKLWLRSDGLPLVIKIIDILNRI